MNIFRKIKAALCLREAIRQADEAHSKNGHRYYVMPTSGETGQLVIMDRDNFRKLKQKGYIGIRTFVSDLERECFYCTPYSNGSGELPADIIKQKRASYYSWLEVIRKIKKAKKEAK